MEEIVYTPTGDSARSGDNIQGYHYSKPPLPLNRGKNKDVEGLKRKEKKNIRTLDEPRNNHERVFEDTHYCNNEYEQVSVFTIGMEIEKNELDACCEKEFALIKGFEHDSSCGYESNEGGYEAITHILPLLPKCQWRSKVYNMMYEAECVIDDEYSPSNTRCGGHISVGVFSQSGEDIRKKIRKNLGIVLALNRFRLNQYYCESNPRLLKTPSGNRYCVALPKPNTLEIRLFSRFTSVRQMMRRYELMYEILDFSYNTPYGRHDSLLKKIKPIVSMMYNHNESKVEEILGLARDFRQFIVRNEVRDSITGFIRERYRTNARVVQTQDVMEEIVTPLQ